VIPLEDTFLSDSVRELRVCSVIPSIAAKSSDFNSLEAKKWWKMRGREEDFSGAIYALIFSDDRDKMSEDKRRLRERLQRAT